MLGALAAMVEIGPPETDEEELRSQAEEALAGGLSSISHRSEAFKEGLHTLKVGKTGYVYVIDREGVVRHVFNSQFAADRHVSEALEVVRRLSA